MQLKPNIGTADKALRVLIALALAALFYMGVLKGVLGAVSLIVSLMLTASTLIGCCPVYTLLGISSIFNKCPKTDDAPPPAKENEPTPAP